MTKIMTKTLTLKLLLLGVLFYGAANATIVESVPESNESIGMPGLSEPSAEFKNFFCSQYPKIKKYEFLAKDGYIMLRQFDFEDLILDYDMLAACLRWEREK